MQVVVRSGDREGRIRLQHQIGKLFTERLPRIRKGQPSMRQFGSGNAGLNSTEVDLHDISVPNFVIADTPQTLGPGVRLNKLEVGFITPRESQIPNGFFVDGKKPNGGAVFRRHVGERRAFGCRERRCTLSEELNELTDQITCSQNLGDREDDIRRCDPFARSSGQPTADYFRKAHGHRLAEHCRCRLDAPNAPADDTQ